MFFALDEDQRAMQTVLRDYLRRNFQKVGVGYYPNSSFVHLDVRKDRSAFWIDYSGPGERAVYSQAPAQDLKTGRAESYHPTKIGEDWVNDPADHPTDRAAAATTRAIVNRMTEAFIRSTQYEWLFWDSAYQQRGWPMMEG